MKLIQMTVKGISYSETQTGAYALILSENEGNRKLPVIIGGFEAQAIAVALENMTPNRPLTHDLFKNTLDAFDINLKGDYVVADSIKNIEIDIKKNEMVSEIIYDKQLVDLVNDNIKKISFWILVISGFFAIIAMLLINSSLRLSIYSHRFTIKTMQMVGATKSFIRKPFIWRSIKLGLLGSGLAIVAILGVVYYVDGIFPNIGIAKDYISIGIVVAGVLLVGILITWISTFFATQRFLNLKTDDLY